MDHIKNGYVELEADDSGWKHVYVIETDLELDVAGDDYDAGAVRELMDELRGLHKSTRFKRVRVRSQT